MQGHLEREEIGELNGAVVDQMLYDSRWFYSVEISTLLSDDEIICKEPAEAQNDQFGFMLFHELWIIYSFGVLISFLGFFWVNGSRYLNKKKGEFWFSGVREERDKYTSFSLY